MYRVQDGKRVNGYMTLEMALVFPAVFALVIMILYTAFFSLRQMQDDAGSIHGPTASIVREKRRRR